MIDIGFTPRAIEMAVANGHLLRLHTGVFALGHMPRDPRAHRYAATVAIGPESSISVRSGAAQFRVLKARPGPIHVSVPSHSGRRQRKGVVVHRTKLAPDERTVTEGVPCTTMSRVLLDLASACPGDLERAIKKAGDRELLKVSECLTLMERYPGKPGSPLLRGLLIGEEPIPEFTRSGLERRMYRLCRDADLPLPDMTVDVHGLSDLHECDSAWPRHRLIIECDSKLHDNPISSVADAKKDQDLTLAGWRVHRLRWAQIVLEPELCARTIRHLLDEQARLQRLAA
ncbi:MAG: DUF559 domain-containing protein [Solirubrobacterales bacterium]